MLCVALAWWATDAGSPAAPTPTPAVRTISWQDHFDGYLGADFVFGEMPPVVLDVETLSDGRLAVRFIRRIEEFGFLDPNAELPVDENGELDAEKLRRVENDFLSARFGPPGRRSLSCNGRDGRPAA